MPTTEVHYLLGLNIFLAIVFTSLVIFIAVRRAHILYMRYISYVLAIIAVETLMEYLMRQALPSNIYLIVGLVYIFVMCALPFVIVLTILALTGVLARSPVLRAKLDILSFITSILFTSSVAFLWTWRSVASALVNGLLLVVVASLIIGLYMLVRALREDTQHKMRLRAILVFIVMNLIAVPIVETIWLLQGPSLPYVLSQTVIMTANTLLMIFFILYIDPQTSQQDRYESLKTKFEDLMRYAGDGIAILDKMGRVISCNSAFACLLGGSPEALKDHRIIEAIPAGQAPAIKNAIDIGIKGSVAKDLRHNWVRKAGKDAKGGLSNHVVSTFSPIKSPEGNLEGVLLITKDTTSAVLLEVEHLLRGRAEAQNQLQRLMTSLMPVLLAGNGGRLNNRDLYLSMLLNKVEKVLCWEGPFKERTCGPSATNEKGRTQNCASTVQDHLCNIMNNLGGSFYWEEQMQDGAKIDVSTGPGPSSKTIVFYGMDCPWGEEAKKNPLFCNLCRGIFTRLLMKVDEGTIISLVSTLANGNHRCEIRGRWAVDERDAHAPTSSAPCDTEGDAARGPVVIGAQAKEAGS